MSALKATASSEQTALRQFIEQVMWLYEPEYGDFKRKLGLYLQRLEEANPAFTTGIAKATLAEIKDFVVYTPNGDIESTRRRVVKMAQDLLASGSIH